MNNHNDALADGSIEDQPLVGTGWQVPITHVHDRLQTKKTADKALRTALADTLNIEACTELSCDSDLAPAKRGRFKGTIRIKASITQECVVTLDPFTSIIDEIVDVEFWPEKQIVAWEGERGEEAEIDGEAPDVEPIENDALDVGRIVYECLTISVDPHPRAPDAVLEKHSTETEDERAAERPFAALEKLRRPENE